MHCQIKIVNSMEIKITTKQILNVLNIFCWIIFLCACVDAGGIICSALYAVLFNPLAAKEFWNGADLASLYSYDTGQFVVVTGYMSIAGVLKAILLYLIVKVFYDKKLEIFYPFNRAVVRLIASVAYLSLGIGVFSLWGKTYIEWIINKGIVMPDIESLRLGGGDVWLLMGFTFLVIVQIFKRGSDIQDEHELTV